MYVDVNGNITQDSRTPLVHFKVFAVYEHPLDFPGKYVLREWRGTIPMDPPICVADTLEEVRTHIPKDMTFVGPDPFDPKLIETWI